GGTRIPDDDAADVDPRRRAGGRSPPDGRRDLRARPTSGPADRLRHRLPLPPRPGRARFGPGTDLRRPGQPFRQAGRPPRPRPLPGLRPPRRRRCPRCADGPPRRRRADRLRHPLPPDHLHRPLPRLPGLRV
ncbi:MAG: Peroxide stress regulator PerR, FUR family, partial [uncultured Thermomicrobiales bacterium]